MKIAGADTERELKKVELSSDLIVVGGGLAGICAAITAAREGLKVVLLQDRPVLGGNASSEVRLWALGATSHQGNNNRWAREGGVLNEIVVENTYRNKEGNPHYFDALLLDKVKEEKNITLLLNTAMIDVMKANATMIAGVRAFNSQNCIVYEATAPYFCDASGDGILGYLSGAAYRIGAEDAEEFNEPFAPDEEYGDKLGHTIYFYTKDTGKPVKYIAPSFALKDITEIPRHHEISSDSHGCSLWWLEYGGRHETIHDTEDIKWELWKVAYGVWDYMKNSGKFPETETMTLEWIGSIPGKRESRRFEGDYMINQSDIIEQKRHEDAISVGGWAIDLHPADGLYSDKPGCTQYHSKGVYQIPYRCMYSRNIDNLFTAGRLISASHVAFGSTRVMMTSGHNAQAVGMAAAICKETNSLPREILAPNKMKILQTRLIRSGQFIPHLEIEDEENLALKAELWCSSELVLDELALSQKTVSLDSARAMLVPAPEGLFPEVTFYLTSETDSTVEFQLRGSEREGNFTPDITFATKTISLAAGKKVPIAVDFETELDKQQYVFICLMPAEGVTVSTTDQLITGIMSLAHQADPKVARSAVQAPPEGSGFDTFEFWLPERRPGGQNLAMKFNPPLKGFGLEQLKNSYKRPLIQSNAWVANLSEETPCLSLRWDDAHSVSRVIVSFDVDYDHAMETVQFGHHEHEMPFCVKHFLLKDNMGNVIFEEKNNYQARVDIKLEKSVTTDSLTIEVLETQGSPAAIFYITVL